MVFAIYEDEVIQVRSKAYIQPSNI